MSSPLNIPPSNRIDFELSQQYEARAENANLTTSVNHLAEDITESLGDLMIPDPITAGILLGLSNTTKLQGVFKQLLPKKTTHKKEQDQNGQQQKNPYQ